MKVGLTLDLSKSFWANGLQQNIVFLYSLLNRLPDTECLYITHSSQSQILNKKHNAILLNDLLEDPEVKLDVLLICGFDLLPDMYQRLLDRNPNLKVVLIHYGNKMMDDIHYAISSPPSRKEPLKTPFLLHEIWISPQHSFASEYLKTYYKCDRLKIAPYIWDSFFVQEKISDLKKQNLNPFYKPEEVARVCVFEPNITHVKNCIIPLSICERSEQLHPSMLQSVNVFCCEKLRGKPYFEKLMNRSSLVKKQPNICYFNNRWGSLTALSKWGTTIISHQSSNDLNYLYFEALYLGLPLIHNSPTLQDVGYYYPDYDVKAGALQLKNAILNHSNQLPQYKGDAQRFLNRFSPYNQNTLSAYREMLNSL
tara:strand:+ start:651 stop:1751 length:1101 start_codon:yes stop_codon:yes gene_type:complete